jgi:hypothetical protein
MNYIKSRKLLKITGAGMKSRTSGKIINPKLLIIRFFQLPPAHVHSCPSVSVLVSGFSPQIKKCFFFTILVCKYFIHLYLRGWFLLAVFEAGQG